MKITRIAISVMAMLCFVGCASTHVVNPSFPITKGFAKAYLKEIGQSDHQLQRPLIIVNGFHDLGVPSFLLADKLRKILKDDRILAVSIEGCRTFDQCSEKLIAEVNRRFPSGSKETIQVDVIGISMGGLVSRYAATSKMDRRLSIRRLFTIGTPHRGSRLANLPALEPIQRDMRPGSTFLLQLSKAKRDYELFPYVRLRDEFVSVEDAAPEELFPWWTNHDGMLSSHGSSFLDCRFVADIVARLLDQSPFSTYPPTLTPTPKH